MTKVMKGPSELGRRCRHWKGMHGCGTGHPIEKIVLAANSGDRTGLLLMLPCRPGPEMKAKCPDYDPYTEEENAQRNAEQKDRMVSFFKALTSINALRERMLAEGVEEVTGEDCPWCNTSGTLFAFCNISGNRHMRANCSSCGKGFIE